MDTLMLGQGKRIQTLIINGSNLWMDHCLAGGMRRESKDSVT